MTIQQSNHAVALPCTPPVSYLRFRQVLDPLACIFLLEPLSFKIEQLSSFRKELIRSNLGQFDSAAACAALFGSTVVFPAWVPGMAVLSSSGGSHLWFRRRVGSVAQHPRQDIISSDKCESLVPVFSL